MSRESETRRPGESRERERPSGDAACSVQTREAEEPEDTREDEYPSGDSGGAGRGDTYADVDTSHLDDVGDGCGCAEVWEHTSREREADAGTD